MAEGVFVGWGIKAIAALAASTAQSWLAGLVAKRLSTVTRSVVQCLELIIIYFVGDLVLKGLPFDWPVGSMALAVALTVQVFAQAGRKPGPGAQPATDEQPDASSINPSMMTAGSADPPGVQSFACQQPAALASTSTHATVTPISDSAASGSTARQGGA
mmetsp:Transcript_66842/g.211566  ORF Transcript_66842/g.211566 Transcript_66842/m.211566 type:complete len:159 (-) Transcript_66842:92-568(-)